MTEAQHQCEQSGGEEALAGPAKGPDRPASSPAPGDALADHWTGLAPAWAQPYLRLSRLDRPVGWQLLLIPCVMGLCLAATNSGFSPDQGRPLALFCVGAIAMRGAGCTFNDIVDAKIDAQVERTRQRPIPAGLVSLDRAGLWLGAQGLLALAAWAGLSRSAQITALVSAPLVGAYPFMKRITWWPQAWLGLCFSWGALVAGAEMEGGVNFAVLLLFAGCVFWVVGYDTIYALQDREDDALVGVRSTARLFGAQWRGWTGAFYVAALFLWGLSALFAGAGLDAIIALALVGALAVPRLLDQIDAADPKSALAAFKANVLLGLAVCACFALHPLWITVRHALGPLHNG